MSINFEAANMAGYNNPEMYIFPVTVTAGGGRDRGSRCTQLLHAHQHNKKRVHTRFICVPPHGGQSSTPSYGY